MAWKHDTATQADYCYLKKRPEERRCSSASNLISMTYNSNVYIYVKNLQGDIIGLVNTAGEMVAEYKYDAWGKVLEISGSLASTVGEKNPFRYRGYYYDSETEMYYLQSRYYDPEVKRFINADAAMGQLGNAQSHNMYTYAFNNPVKYSDLNGNWPKLSSILTGIAVGAAVIAVGALCVATVVIAGGSSILTATATTAVALGVAEVAAKGAVVSTGAAAVSKVVETSSSQKLSKKHTVYGLQDSSGKIQYVGRTTNVNARKNAHKANPARAGLEMTIIADDLSREAARGVEQTYMLYYHTINTKNAMNNQINGISPNNPNIGVYMEAAKGAMGYAWNQVSNEVLYWTGN